MTPEQLGALYLLVMGLVMVVFFVYCSEESWNEVRKLKSQTFTKGGIALFFGIAASGCFMLTSYDAIALFIQSKMCQKLVWWGCAAAILILPGVIGMKKEKEGREAA